MLRPDGLSPGRRAQYGINYACAHQLATLSELDLLAEQCHHYPPVHLRYRACAFKDGGETFALYLAQFVLQFVPFRGKCQAPDTVLCTIG